MKRVAVLRGGPSDEYEVSMQTGAAVLAALQKKGYDARDVVITKEAQWLDAGRIRDHHQILNGVDVVFIALHGTFGEDGTLQRLIEPFAVPYTGSGALSSSIAFNKDLTKRSLEPYGVTMAKDYRLSRPEIVSLEDELSVLRSHLGDTVFLKPLASGSSVGARKISITDCLQTSVEQLLLEHEHLLAEEYIDGIEATVGVLENYRGEEYYTFPVIEIVPPSEVEFFDNTSKYNGTTKEIVPAGFANDLRDELQKLARHIHKSLDLKQYSRSDFLIKDGEIYFLEVNTLPGLTAESLMPKAAAAVGMSFEELVSHLVETAVA